MWVVFCESDENSSTRAETRKHREECQSAHRCAMRRRAETRTLRSSYSSGPGPSDSPILVRGFGLFTERREQNWPPCFYVSSFAIPLIRERCCKWQKQSIRSPESSSGNARTVRGDFFRSFSQGYLTHRSGRVRRPCLIDRCLSLALWCLFCESSILGFQTHILEKNQGKGFWMCNQQLKRNLLLSGVQFTMEASLSAKSKRWRKLWPKCLFFPSDGLFVTGLRAQASPPIFTPHPQDGWMGPGGNFFCPLFLPPTLRNLGCWVPTPPPLGGSCEEACPRALLYWHIDV